ncbi:uncharacterized protein LOC130663103 [Microplitis mediator]|uniref:uncharacterized protein LOC130663103 n=1 Tax=Microplitis mediator TaxID=375433 RepID=UPI002557B4E9|nr:uncharacterized protein LOC130663103 [Microplitis mediator]
MNKLTGIMETKEHDKKSMDDLTHEASFEPSTHSIVVVYVISLCLVTGHQILWDSQGILNYKAAYLCYGLTIGTLMSISVKLLSHLQCVNKVDWKYRCKFFSLYGISQTIMAVLELSTLYSGYFMSEEDLIKICGWKCPLPSLILGMTLSFCYTCTLIFCIHWLYCRFKNSWLMEKFI